LLLNQISTITGTRGQKEEAMKETLAAQNSVKIQTITTMTITLVGGNTVGTPMNQ
jgi:hypothetical protein